MSICWVNLKRHQPAGFDTGFQLARYDNRSEIGGLLILSATPLAIEQLRQLTPQSLHAYRVQQAASVKLPYVVIGVALLLLAVLIGVSRLPKIEDATSRSGERGKDTIWKHPNLLLAQLAFSPMWAPRFRSEAFW